MLVSQPKCPPSHPSETWLQSAIDFSSWIVTNYPRADVIAERGCKVCIKLLLFVSSSLQFTVLGRMFVSWVQWKLTSRHFSLSTHPMFRNFSQDQICGPTGQNCHALNHAASMARKVLLKDVVSNFFCNFAAMATLSFKMHWILCVIMSK